MKLFPLIGLFVSIPAFAATWQVDATHSHVGFSVSHMTISTVRGSFGEMSGIVEYDPANMAAMKVDATIKVDSIDTDNTDRDTHLKQADFFESAKYPEMKFKSKSVKNVTATGFDLVGDLTIRNITKEVTFKVASFKPEVKDPWGNTKTGTSATTVINRQDFGVNYSKTLDTGGLMVGNDVTLILDIELNKAK